MKIIKANIKDLNFFYNCRNDSRTRLMMVNTKFIRIEEHKKWFSSAIRSNKYFLYVGKIKKKIGIVIFSFDEISYNVDISITIHPEYRKKKLSSILLKKAIRKFKKDLDSNINLIARIKEQNKASIKCFLKSGFIFSSKLKNMLYFKLPATQNNPRVRDKKIVAIVQARQTSTRFPNKVLKKICNIPLIKILLARLSKSKKINEIILSIPDNKKNLKLYNEATRWHETIYKGDEKNVLKRYYDTAKKYNADIILRVTGDCPLIDPKLADNLINFFKKKKVDYVSNNLTTTFPHGLDMEVFSFKALKNAYLRSTKKYQKEHVTYYITENKKFKKANFASYINYSDQRWTIDQKEDLRLISLIIKNYYPNIYFSWKKVIKFMKENKHLNKINNHLKQNTG